MKAHYKISYLILTTFLILSFVFNSCRKEVNTIEDGQSRGNIQLITPSFFDSLDPSTYIVASSFVIDSKGNKWMGYDGGLFGGIIKYDGSKWERFTNSNIPVPLQRYVHVQTEAKDGSIYFLTWADNESRRLIVQYKDGNWNYWDIKDVMSVKRLFANEVDNFLYFYKSGNIFKAALNANFALQSSYQKVISLNISPYIGFMDCTYGLDKFYITGASEAYKISLSGETETLPTINGSSDFDISVSKNGNPYAVVAQSKIYKLEGSMWSHIPFIDEKSPYSTVLNLAIDKKSQIYFQTNNGIAKIINGKISYYYINKEFIFTWAPILIDKDNVKWIVYYKGLIRILD